MKWIDKWQNYVGFQGKEKSEEHPGKIDNNDIVEEVSRSGNGTVVESVKLAE